MILIRCKSPAGCVTGRAAQQLARSPRSPSAGQRAVRGSARSGSSHAHRPTGVGWTAGGSSFGQREILAFHISRSSNILEASSYFACLMVNKHRMSVSHGLDGHFYGCTGRHRTWSAGTIFPELMCTFVGGPRNSSQYQQLLSAHPCVFPQAIAQKRHLQDSFFLVGHLDARNETFLEITSAEANSVANLVILEPSEQVNKK